MIHARTISPLIFVTKIYTVLSARQTVKCLRAIVTLPEELGSVPITHMAIKASYL